MVATGIQEGGPQAQKYAVVQPVAKAVGSSYESADARPGEPQQESSASLISRSRLPASDELPLFDLEGESKLDVPTFLRRQAD
jgi:hypothetical protein